MFTDEERKLLANYVTSSEDDIFAVKGMPGMVGAAYARYSRAKGGFREVLLKEFIKEGVIDPVHADKLIERILIAFGDDSVGELEGCHVSFENISMVATKEIEHRRIGGSPIEQSTRYVFYDQQNEKGEWRYLRDESLVNASFGAQYVETMDFVFHTYADLVGPMQEYFKKFKPLEEADYDVLGTGKKQKYADLAEGKDQKAFRITYGFDVRSKACDALRALLPLATLTNVGMFGNGRFYQHTISHLISTDIPEARQIGEQTLAATGEMIKQYVRRARRSEYAVTNRGNMRKLAHELVGDAHEQVTVKPATTLMPQDDRDVATIAAMVYPHTHLSLATLRKKVTAMDASTRERVIDTYIGKRETRRDRPGRALEDGYPYTFDMVTNWGVYKDLMRHRMNTQQIQLWSTKLGFEMPEEIVAAGFAEQAQKAVDKMDALYDTMAKENPTFAQYAVMHGHFIRWSIGMNDREAMHLTELRTVAQGHAQYRKVAQMMHREIEKVSPWRAKMMRFVDYNDYYWSRADAEAKQRVKERKWEEKYGIGE